MSKRFQKEAHQKVSRRQFLATAAVAGVSAGALGFPHAGRVKAASPIKLKIQTVWEGGTLGYRLFQEFCKNVGKLSNGKLLVDGYPAGTIVETFEMFDAVKARVFDGMHSFDAYWWGKMPVAAFLSSYPFGLDRPDQWETWYHAMGGREIAEEAYGRHNMQYIGPIQQGENLIHSKIPIRSVDDFKGKKIKCHGGITADLFQAIGAETVPLPGDDVHPTMGDDTVDALFYGGAAIHDMSGYNQSAKYILMDPPAASCLHQPVNIMSFAINRIAWKLIPPPLQILFEAAVAIHSYEQYAAFQAADIDVYEKLKKGTAEKNQSPGNSDTESIKMKGQNSDFHKAEPDTGSGLLKEPEIEFIHFAESDIEQLKRLAPAQWMKWAKKSTLAMKAFKSQLAFMKSMKLGYVTDADLTDLSGRKLEF